MPTRRSIALVLFFAFLILTAVLVTVISVRMMSPDNWSAHDQPHGHQWLHEELDLTETEAAAIDAFEEPYREQRVRLQKQFEEKIQAIARLLQTTDAFSPEVSQAIHDLHIVHGQLQELSIHHYFDMLNALPSDKKERLRELAAEALSTPQ